MVQMHPLSQSTTSVSFEDDGGIRNPACQDDDLPDIKLSGQQQQHRETHVRLPAKRVEEPNKIHEKGREIKEAMTICRTRVPWKFSGNIVVGLFVLAVLALGELGFMPYQQFGFYCNDPKMSFKYTGDTISIALLLIVTIAVPAFVMWVTEWSCYSPECYKSLESASCSRSKQLWMWYGYYSIGWIYLIFVVEIAKVIVGEPRPHFFDSCRPDVLVNCTGEYRKKYRCTNTEMSWLIVSDSDKSFPSGHSAISIFMAIFLVSYLQNRMPNRSMLLLVKPWLQCLAVLWGVGCSTSRIVDHRHHWWDVLAGATLGVVFAVFSVRFLCRDFRWPPGSGNHEEAALAVNVSSGFVNANKRHQSIKKLLSTGSSMDVVEGRELGDMPTAWTA